MRFSTIAISTLVGIALGALPLLAYAAEGKSAAQDKPHAATAPPTHAEFYGKTVPLAPRGPTKVRQPRGMREMKKDLTVTGLHVPDTVRLGEPFRVSFYIRNHGMATIPQVSYKVAWRVLIPLITLPAEELAAGVAHNVPGGRDVRIEHTVVFASDVLHSDLLEQGAGWPALAAIVDPDEAIDEDDEDNNSMGVILTLAVRGE
jgi:hypothetical protein